MRAASSFLAILIAMSSITLAQQDSSLLLEPPAAAKQSLARVVEDRDHVTIIELDGNYDRLLPDGTTNAVPRTAVAQEFYSQHPDTVDFLVVFTTFEFDTGIARAFHLGVRNEIEGINEPVFDNSMVFGSNGVLQGYVDMADLDRHELNPVQPAFDETLDTLVHELMHQWTAHVRFVDTGGSLSNQLLSTDLAHWSFLLDTDASLMYGNDWRDNGDGTFTSVAVRHQLSPLDLYLAGFYAAHEVPPMLLIEDGGTDPGRLPEANVTIGGTARVVRIDDIIAAEGARVPAAGEAQRDFRVAFILLVRPGEVAEEVMIVALDNVRHGLLNRFPILTGGRAVVNVFPPEDPGVQVGSPTPVSGGELRPGAASLNDALTWLRSRQALEGYWQDTLETRPRDTAVCLSTLHRLDPVFAGTGAALTWFDELEFSNTDELARAAVALDDAGADGSALRGALLALQRPDGGWGLAAGYDSDPMDTAVAMLALVGHADAPASALGTAAEYLLARQGSDGGWNHHGQGASRVVVTTTVLEALHASGRSTGAAAAWLASQQNPDGGFGDSPSTAHDTANVLLSLMRLGEVAAIDAGAAVSYLDATQTVAGSWEGSTYTTALVASALKRFTYPNWAVSQALVANPVAPRDGDVVRLTAELVNDGNAFAPQGVIRLYQGEPEAGGVLVGELAIPTMAPLATATATFLWDSFDQAGVQTLVAVVDPDGTVPELSEVDNRASVTLSVAPPPAGIDLEVSEPGLAVDPARPATIPAVLAISGTVRNLGLTDAGTVTVALWLGEPGTGVRLDETQVTLAPRGSAPVSFNHTLTTPGTTLFTIAADPDDAVAEEDESNNLASITVTTDGTVDYQVSDADLGMEGDPWLGHDVVFRAALRNQGTLEAPEVTVRFLVDDGSEELELRVDRVALAAGEEVERTLTWRVDRIGNLRFVVQVDPANEVSEQDETNNGAGLDFVASEATGFNLSLSHADMSFDPDPAREGAAVTLSALLRNTAGEDVSNAEVAFFDGDPTAGGVQVGSTVVVPSLAAGDSTTVSTVMPALAHDGDRIIFVVADPAGAIAELDEDDNTAFSILEVLSLPDLAVTLAGLGLTPPYPDAGDPVTLTVDVANLGEQDATGVVVRLLGDGVPLAPDQVLPVVAGGDVAQAVFSWTFPAQGGTVHLQVVADPDGAITEGAEDNNQAARDVMSRDPNEPLSHRYFSPNGDGVQDTTVFFFALPGAGSATFEARDLAGARVRRATGIPANPDGTYEWDGRTDGGAVVEDGEYRLAILDATGAVVREALATVDTNHSPLFDAVGTSYARFTNLTCGARGLDEPQMPVTEDSVYFRRRRVVSGDTISEGVFRADARGEGVERLFQVRSPLKLELSDDGEWLAYTQRTGTWSGYSNWYRKPDGTGATQFYYSRSFDFRPDTEELLYSGSGGLHLRPLDGSGPDRLVGGDAQLPVAPDGAYVMGEGGGTYRIVNVDSGAAVDLSEPLDENTERFAWAPDSSRLAIAEVYWEGAPFGLAGWLRVFDTDGNMLHQFDIPLEPMDSIAAFASLDPPSSAGATIDIDHISELSWSGSSDELVFYVAYTEWGAGWAYQAEFGRLFRADLTSGELETVAWLEPWVNRTYHISTWDGSTWVDRGSLHTGMRYVRRVLDLEGVLPDADGELKVRIRQTGSEAAHVDQLALFLGAGGPAAEYAPTYARHLGTGEDVLDLVQRVDRDVLDLGESEVELRWSLPADSGVPDTVQLTLFAREENLSGRNARPFSYPPARDRVYDYLVRDRGGLLVDGIQSAADNLGEPLFAERSLPNTGHPGAVVYGYATADAANLYAVLDFTVDNTEDDDADWASLLVETAGGWQEFRVTTTEQAHGTVGFTHTGRVHHAHKYYEFKVPLAAIGAREGDSLKLRFAAYGTAAVITDEAFFLPNYGQDPLWLPGERRVLYSGYFGPAYTVDLDHDNVVTRILLDHEGFSDNRLTPTRRGLLFRSDRDILDPQSACYNPQASTSTADWFLYRSLANMTAELRVSPTGDGRGVLLEGTASDLHFKQYTLEFADEALPGFWLPIEPPSAQQVFDDVFTTWVPPGSSSYLVRLTVEDLAGNRRTALRRIPGGWGAASISDLSLSPRLFSPNGDGVLDTTTLHYLVQQPVHLEVSIYNQAGDRVRLFQQDHATIGAEVDLVWDGRDLNGLPVPDGDYRVELQGFEFHVTVDTTPPQVTLTLSDALTEAPGDDVSHVDVAPALAWCVVDANPEQATLSSGLGASPLAWNELQSVRLRQQCSPLLDRMELGLEEFVDHRFRIQAHDAAGNTATTSTGLGGQELILAGFGVDEILPPPFTGVPAFILDRGLVTLRVAETVRRPLAQLWVQVRPAADPTWFDVPMPGSALDEHWMDLLWDMAEIRIGEETEVRLRAVDVDGVEYLSNPLFLAAEGIDFKGVVDAQTLQDPLLGPALRALAAEAGLDPEADTVLWAIEGVAADLVDLQLVLDSTEDPNFTGGAPLPPAVPSDGVVIFDGRDLLPCMEYVGFVTASTPPDPIPRTFVSQEERLQLPCLAVTLAVAALPADQCDAPAPHRSAVTLTPTRFNDVELRTLTLALDAPDNVIFNVNAPVDGQEYSTEIDTLAMAEGGHRLMAVLGNGEGEQALDQGWLVVDHSPPVVAITYPLDGQRECATAGPGGAVIGVEGAIEDLGLGCSYALSYELASHPGEWIPAAFSRLDTAPGTALELLSHHGPLGDLSNPHGEVTARLEATDLGGSRACTEVSFLVDGEVEGALGATDRNLISPDGDGYADAVLFQYAAAEAFNLSLAVFQAVDGPTGLQPTGPALVTLANHLPVLGGGAMGWDGTDGGGSLLADGRYMAVMVLEDGCLNTSRFQLPVEIDTTPPLTLISLPAAGTLTATVVEVWGTASDLHFLDFGLDFGEGAVPTSWSQLATGNDPVSDALLAVWSTSGLVGDHTLRLWARDRAGNQGFSLVTVDLSPAGDLISSLEALPHVISPNGDGAADATAIRFNLLRDAAVTLQVVDGSDVVVRTLTSSEPMTAGAAVRPWDGLGDGGTPVPDGSYRLRLTATTADPSQQVESVTVVVDSTPPSLAVTRPAGGFVAATGTVLGSVLDPNLSEYTVALAVDPAAPAWSQLAHGTTQVANGDLGSLEGLAEGEYGLRVQARDRAENRAETVLTFTVDNTAPEVVLAAPAAGDAVSGQAAVTGELREAHPGTWVLELGVGETPAAWVPVASGAGAPTWPVLWDTTVLADGPYTLRLAATDAADNTGQASVLVRVDNTAPVALITAPATGGHVTAATAVEGTAADDDLLRYRLDVAPFGTEAWAQLGVRVTPVSNGTLLRWETLPLDGDYTLRLRVEDRAGHLATATANLTVDTRPPAPPTGLAAEVVANEDVSLTWNPNGESDLAGYRVYRSGVQVSASLVTDPAHLDPTVPEGTFVYTVTAVDEAGLESEHSAGAEVVVDRTPPAARIHAPAAGERLAGLVDVMISADAPDLAEYRLFAGTALLVASPLGVQAEAVAQLDTTGLGDGPLTLRLEAEDASGNVGTFEVAVVVDNQAPAAPTGLVAVASGADANLTWNPNSEPDLLGYVVSRNGHLLGVPDGAVDLRPYALGATSTADPGLPDGEHRYVVMAVDEAGNISPPSLPDTVTIDLRAPQALIVDPADGDSVDRNTYVLATAADLDVAEVRFQFQALGDSLWSDVAVDAQAPWETHWDPSGLPYGDYRLRAVATDQGGQTDAAPAAITLTYTDLTRPAPVQGVTALVDGGSVELSWNANPEADLAGYHVERTGAGGTTVRLTATPWTLTGYTDSGLDDSTYTYAVIAVDTFDNEADPSALVTAWVYTPVLERPFSATAAATVDFSGQGAAAASVAGTINDGGGGTRPLPPAATDGDGRFAVTGAPLGPGINTVEVTITDADGNRSKAGSFQVQHDPVPSAPTGVAATAGGYDVDLSWNTNPEPEVVGYRVFRNGAPVLPPDPIISFVSLTASSTASSRYPNRAVDGSLGTYWAPVSDADEPVAGQWWQADWAAPALLSTIQVQWYSADCRAVDYDLEAWHLGGWMHIAEVRGNTDELDLVQLPDPYTTDSLRLVVLRAALPDTAYPSLCLAEVDLEAVGYVAATAHADLGVADGFHDYTVSALTGYHEGPQSAPAQVAVGDVVPPDPVVLSASVSGSDVSLSWTASTATDLASYHVFRDGFRIADVAALSHLDASLVNGDYTYVVRAVDLTGNVGAASNAVNVQVSVPVLPAPVNLAVSAPPEGGSLDLSWQAAPGPVPLGYRVHRSTTQGGPWEAVALVAGDSHHDPDLANGTTYYYVVTSLDAVGNDSPPSNEAWGTPEDTVPPPTPSIHTPTTPGTPYPTTDPLLGVLAGQAEPGTAVRVFRGGARVASTVASTTAGIDRAGFETWSTPYLSPTGRHLWIDDSPAELYDFETGARASIEIYGTPRWYRSGDRVAYAEYDSTVRDHVLRSYNIGDGTVEDLCIADWVSLVVPSPDGTALLALGRPRGGSNGVWLVDPATDTWTQLVALSTWMVEERSLLWSPDGSKVAFIRYSPGDSFEIIDVSTLASTVVATPGGSDTLAWSDDGTALLFSLADGVGYRQLWRYRLADGHQLQLTDTASDHEMGCWSADGTGLVYVEDGARVMHLDLASGAATNLLDLAWWRWEHQVVPSGFALVVDDREPIRIAPAGRFEVHNLALDAGDNVFTATSSDGTGNSSPPSAPVIVNLLGSSLPDLALAAADLGAVPAIPIIGEAARLSVTVRNSGAATAPATDLAMVLVQPDGSSVDLAAGFQLGSIGPGASETQLRDVVFAGDPGVYRLIAAADPLDRVAEVSDDNNRAVLELVVLAEATPQLALTTDREVCFNNEDVLISVRLLNGGPLFNGRLDLRVEDLAGYPAQVLPVLQVQDLATGDTLDHDAVWNSGDLFAGPYQVRARLYDGDNVLVAGAVAAIAIEDNMALDATVLSDRAAYRLGDTATFTAGITYVDGNSVLSGAELRLRVLDSSATLVAEWTEALATLYPGTGGSYAFAWQTAATGTYSAQLELSRDGAVLATAATAFDVVEGRVQLGGELVLEPSAPPLGVGLAVSYAITNLSPVDVTALPVRLVLLDAATGQVLETVPTTHDVASGASVSGHAVFDTNQLALATYLLRLEADLPDALADVARAQQATLASTSFSTLDRTPPLVAVEQPLAGGFLAAASRIVATAVDTYSRVVSTQASLDGGPWLSLSQSGLNAGSWSLLPAGLTEGPHTLVARATDTWGNTATTGQLGFTADLTPPLIIIQGVSDGLTYTTQVVPVIEIVETFPATDSATLNGVPYVSGTPVTEEGVYHLVAAAHDQAGNYAVAEVRFTLGQPEVPDLAASKTDQLAADNDTDGVLSPGDELAFRITLSATGTGTLTNVVLEDALPAATSYVAASAVVSQGTVTATDPFTVAVGSMNAGDTVTIDLRVLLDGQYPAGVSQLENQAVVRCDQLADLLSDDPDLPGTSDPTVCPVTAQVAEPVLEASKSVTLVTDHLGDLEASPDDVLEYVITLANTGDADATGVSLSDQVPQYTQVVAGSLTAPGGTVVSENPVEVWFGTLAVDQVEEVRFQVRVNVVLPANATEVVNQGQLLSAELGQLLTDDPDQPGSDDPTAIALNRLGAQQQIPVLEPWGMVLLILMLAMAGLGVLRTRTWK